MRKRRPLRNTLEYLLVRSTLSVLSRLPFKAAFMLARGWFSLLDRAAPKLRRTAIRNLELAYPDSTNSLRRQILSGLYLSLARSLVIFARLPALTSNNIERYIRYEGYEHFHNARAAGRGVLFATAHLGNWELSAYAHALLTRPMHVVVRPLDNPLLDRLVDAYRSGSGNWIIGKREYVRSILRALKANEAVGILVDQNVLPEDGAFVDLFGIPACTSLAFAKLAARSGAAVIPGVAVWSDTENRYILRFQTPVAMSGDPLSDTQAIQSRIEALIREYPEQWLWFHRRWKTRPPGQPPLY